MISGPTGAATLSLLSTMPHQPALAEAFRNGPLAVWRQSFERDLGSAPSSAARCRPGLSRSIVAETTSALLVQRWLLTGEPVDDAYADEVLDDRRAARSIRQRHRAVERADRRAHQPRVPGSPLNGPTTSSVIQPP